MKNAWSIAEEPGVLLEKGQRKYSLHVRPIRWRCCCFLGPFVKAPNTLEYLGSIVDRSLSTFLFSAIIWLVLPGDWHTLPACSPYCLVCSHGFKRTQTLVSFPKNFRIIIEHNLQLYIPRKPVSPLRFLTSGLPVGSSEVTMAKRPFGRTEPALYGLRGFDLYPFFLWTSVSASGNLHI